MRSSCLVLASAFVAAAASRGSSQGGDPSTCVNATNTACAAGRTCCQTEYSNSNWGCCMSPGAVCCGARGPPLPYAPLPSWGVGYCCPAGSKCNKTPGGQIQCVTGSANPSPAKFVCKPGASRPPSSSLPNVMVLGDSVSIGYEPPTAAALAKVALVQHSPWDTRGGGAGATSYGRACLDNLLTTSMGLSVSWDVIVFNFGLHNLDNSTAAEQQYTDDLRNITARLVATGSKIVYTMTTPYMPAALVGNNVVPELNTIAAAVMKHYNVPTVDLYSRVTDKCGQRYTSCPICRKDPCSYHYTPAGYEWISAPLVAAIQEQL